MRWCAVYHTRHVPYVVWNIRKLKLVLIMCLAMAMNSSPVSLPATARDKEVGLLMKDPRSLTNPDFLAVQVLTYGQSSLPD